jgi:hypothetical protein
MSMAMTMNPILAATPAPTLRSSSAKVVTLGSVVSTMRLATDTVLSAETMTCHGDHSRMEISIERARSWYKTLRQPRKSRKVTYD